LAIFFYFRPEGAQEKKQGNALFPKAQNDQKPCKGEIKKT